MPSSLRRSDFLADHGLQGRAFCEAYTDLIESWLGELFAEAGGNQLDLALVAVGGQGRRELAPQSDLDLLLLLGKGVDGSAVADGLWYPIWDTGLKLGHAVRSVRDTLSLAAEDLETATALLSARHVAGNASLTEELAEKAKAGWRKRGRKWLDDLAVSVSARHAEAGEVAFDLEPDLKDGRGGLRDVHALAWARAAGAEVDPKLLVELQRHHDTLLAVRIELHRIAARPGDRLLLSEQDAVAAALGDADADVLMSRVAAAGRAIAWASDESWYETELRSGGGLRERLRRERPLDDGLVLRNGRVCLADATTPVTDPDAVVRVALGAARAGRRIDLATLAALETAPPLPDPWPEQTRRRFVDLVLNGPASIPVVEALDQFGLWCPILPEWEHTRSLPQRNVFHRYTVDRHLLECSAEAASIAHRTPRPDLLVVAALLHDIGKGYPGDHSELGEELARRISTRMGFGPDDVDTIAMLVRHHLLLSDVATRRDLDDPATVDMVVDVVRTPERLALLRALSEADGLATGPTAWGPWKAQLVEQLAARVAARLNGEATSEARSGFPTDAQRELMRSGSSHVLTDGERITVVAPDRRGLFFRLAGVISLHGLDVVEANVASEDGVAIDEFRVVVGGSGVVPWAAIEADVTKALEGRLAVQARLEERARSQRRRRIVGVSQFPPRVRFDNDTASGATVIEAIGPDRLGLLYGLARTMADLDLDVQTARIHTMGGDVVDTFYVTDANGEKILDADYQSEIRRALMHVLDPTG
jgi:[protein-PII] uridylyltransferase